jgi:hypothetical protein
LFLSSRERSLRASKTKFLFYTEVDTTKTRKGLNHVEENYVGHRNIGIPASFGHRSCRADLDRVLLQIE